MSCPCPSNATDHMNATTNEKRDLRRFIVLRARGLTVTVMYDDFECITARLDTVVQHTFWSFLGCGRERRIPIVRVNAWTIHGGPFSTTIEVDDEVEASAVLDSLLMQIPHDVFYYDEDADQEFANVVLQEDTPIVGNSEEEIDTVEEKPADEKQKPEPAEEDDEEEEEEEHVAEQPSAAEEEETDEDEGDVAPAWTCVCDTLPAAERVCE